MYKVFFNNKVLYFVKSPLNGVNSEMVQQYSSITDKKEFINSLFTNTERHNIIQVIEKNIEKCWEDFCSYFEKINAAGGVVRNNNKEYLFIKRRGFWDLPKGKCEKNEKNEKCAEREIEEECGIHDLKLKKKITETYHTYILNDNWILKRTYWFLFRYKGNEIPVPETEEDIAEVRWFKKSDTEQILSNTYLSIIDVIKTLGI